MPHCQNCGAKWSWGEMMKLAFKGKNECANCHKAQYVSAKSNFWSSFLLSLPFILTMSYMMSYGGASYWHVIVLLIAYLPIAYLFMPFILRLSNTRKRFGKTIE